jgi:hypothetical protein
LSPEYYGQSLIEICLVRPEYAVAIIGRWAKPEYDQLIPWEIVIHLFEGLLKKYGVTAHQKLTRKHGGM